MRQVNFWKPENSNSVRVRIPYWFDTRHKWGKDTNKTLCRKQTYCNKLIVICNSSLFFNTSDNKMIESIKSVLYDIQAMACIEFYPLNKNWLFFKSSKSMATSAKDHPPGIHKNQTDLQTQKLAGFIHFLQQDGCWAMIGRQTLPKRHDKSAVSLGPSSENVDLDILKTLSAGLIQGTQVSLTFPECSHPGTVTHELLHVLGFAHEHDRADRDRFLYVHRKAIKPGFVQNFGLQPDYREGRYDPESILHYRADSFSRVRHVPVLEPLDSRSSTRWWHSGGCHRKKCSIYLSPGDIQKLQSRYGTC